MMDSYWYKQSYIPVIYTMQSPQFREIIAYYDGFKLFSEQSDSPDAEHPRVLGERLETLNNLLRNPQHYYREIPISQMKSNVNLLYNISPDVNETRTYIHKLKNINMVDFKVKQVYQIPKTVSYYGGELVVRENGLAEWIAFGSGRPVIGYTVGYIAGPNVPGTLTNDTVF